MKMALLRIGVAWAITCATVVPVSANLVAGHDEATANPIRRVVTMLQSMAKKIEAEGAKEKEIFEKFDCYCRTSGSSLQGGIAAAETKIPQVEASLEEAKSTKARLEQELKDHQVARTDAEQAISEATAIREKEAAEFAKEKGVYDTNIAAVKGAVSAISNGMAGGFVQTGAGLQLQHIISNTADLGSYDRDLVTAFLMGKQANGYIPVSSEVLGILKTLQEDFEKELAEITTQEDEAKATFADLVAAKEKEIAANTKAIEDKTVRVGNLGVEMARMEQDIKDTSTELDENKKFFADIEKDCAGKKAAFEANVKARAEELVAVHETIKILNDDDALDLFKKTLGAPSLMQTTSTSVRLQDKALAIINKVRPTMRKSERSSLDLLAMALTGRKVSFDKVFKLIDSLVKTLKEEQVDDDHKKEYCEGQLDTTDDKKKVLQEDLKRAGLDIEDSTELIGTLAEEIKQLTKGIATLDKEVAESTEVRKEEHEAYTELMTDNSAAKELLGMAKNRLNKFYNPALYTTTPAPVMSEEEKIAANFGVTDAPAALVQIHQHRGVEAPPPPPESFGPYAKKASMSNGILAMLDRLIADLDKEMQTAEVEEKNSQKQYEAYLEDAAEKRAIDSRAITDKEVAKGNAEVTLEKSKESQTAKTKELMAVEQYMSNLHGECDWLLKNFDLRKSARASEVEALQAAKAVLAGADFSLFQQDTHSEKRALRGML
mmetsp:Transcript_33146/g.77551  ORF Transcript_33146/g.77551 Transcript_33146/m.77551 type:complete len:719 (-) Transcript_33146:75-2231(-)